LHPNETNQGWDRWFAGKGKLARLRAAAKVGTSRLAAGHGWPAGRRAGTTQEDVPARQGPAGREEKGNLSQVFANKCKVMFGFSMNDHIVISQVSRIQQAERFVEFKTNQAGAWEYRDGRRSAIGRHCDPCRGSKHLKHQ